MLTEEQLAHRIWLEETQLELKALKTKLNNNTNAVISSLINGCVNKLLSR